MASTDASPLPAVPRPTSRRRLWLILAGGALLAGALVACEGWAHWEESCARRALADEHYDEAQRRIDLALSVRARRTATNLLAARIARLQRAYPEAELRLGRCAELDGTITAPVQLEWLLLRCQRGEVDEVAPALLALVDGRDAESVTILEALAGVYMRQTRYREALGCLNQWVTLAPDSARALDWRGWVSNQLDHRAEALGDYERALELQPGRALVRLRLAQLLVESSRHPEAVPHLERLRAEQPANSEVLIALAQCRFVEGRGDEARALLDTVLAAHPEDSDALLQRGKVEQGSGNPTEAEPWLRKALERSSHNAEARYALYLCLQAQPSRQDEARRELARWEEDRKIKARLVRLLRTELDRRPRDPDLAREAGELLLEVGEDEKALFWLYRALALDPRHAASHRTLAAYYERTNNPTRAAEHREKLTAIGPAK